MRKLIVTGDDFGFAVPVNAAIEEAHRSGILTTASLMVGAAAAADAVDRARRLPSLRVGLHVVLVDGSSVLSPTTIPDLVDEHGKFSSRLVASGIKYFFHPRTRRQLEKEIRAQFEAFKKTGLPLDHVNTHNHMHLHPAVLGLLLQVGREYGMNALRIPHEPVWRSWRASRNGLGRKLLMGAFLFPWIMLVKWRLRQEHVRFNDYVFGLHDSGRMESDLVIRFLRNLPRGVTEIYFHPARGECPELEHAAPGYSYEREFEALTSPAVGEIVHASGLRRMAFSDL